MIKRVFLGVAIFVIMGFTISSCGSDDDVDNEKPVISNLDPMEGEELQIGSDIHFIADFGDNVALASYKVDIHHNFDNHGQHSSKSAVEDTSDSIKFSYSNSWTLEGKNRTIHHHEIKIPKSVVVDGVTKYIRPGKYHLMVYCLDAAGNQSVVAHGVILSENAKMHDHDED